MPDRTLVDYDRSFLRDRAKEIRTISKVCDSPNMTGALLEIAEEIEHFVARREPVTGYAGSSGLGVSVGRAAKASEQPEGTPASMPVEPDMKSISEQAKVARGFYNGSSD